MLLDTHFLIWTALDSKRLNAFPWLKEHRPWAVSPVSLLEIKFLGEVGRLDVKEAFFDRLRSDARYVIDEPPMDALIQAALPLDWTRDPFDRMLCAHSIVRRLPFCSFDRGVKRHHPLVARQLR